MAFLNERSQHSWSQVLHVRICRRWSRVREEMSSFHGDFVQDKRADDAVDRHHAELL